MNRFTIMILSIGCVGDKSDTAANDLENLNIGTCLHYGEVDNAGDSVLKCIQPTGHEWNRSNFQTACESDWDDHGRYESDTDTCPKANLAGVCNVPNGGYLIGATYESETGGFSGLLHYYSDDSSIDPASNCESLRGDYSPSE